MVNDTMAYVMCVVTLLPCLAIIFGTKKRVRDDIEIDCKNYKHLGMHQFLYTSACFGLVFVPYVLTRYRLKLPIYDTPAMKYMYFSFFDRAELMMVLAFFSLVFLSWGYLILPKAFFCPDCGRAIFFETTWKCKSCGKINEKRLIIDKCKRCQNTLTSVKCPNANCGKKIEL